METSTDTTKRVAPSTAAGTTKQACLACRSVKMKCRMAPDQSTCQRCTRRATPCVFRTGKRGRKPALRRPATETAESTITTPTPDTDTSPVAGPTYNLDQSGLSPMSIFGADTRVAAVQQQQQPSSLSSSPAGVVTTCSPPFQEDDPIARGLVSQYVAASLFHGFMTNINPLVCVLDPVLYTFSYVRSSSAFLLTVILAIAARAFNPPLHASLYDAAEDMYIRSFRRGTRSVETIQAFLLFTYWKPANDNRSWAAIGYVIRLCMELGWHRLRVSSNNSDPVRGTSSELEIRQIRNVERTWLVLYIHDRGASLQTGRPWMIERSDFLESVNSWYKSPYAIPLDATVCALATLRLTTSDVVEVLNPQRPSEPMTAPQRINPLLRTLTPQLDAWQKHWSQARPRGDDASHAFLVKLFCNHTRLFLYAFSLQGSLSFPAGGPLIDNEAFSIAYSSALDMLRAIQDPSAVPMLSFMHDAVHIMLAYAAIFLVKLLLSVHLGIRREVESAIISTIKSTAETLSALSMPTESSCAIHARFYQNLLQDYEKKKKEETKKATAKSHHDYHRHDQQQQNQETSPSVPSPAGEEEEIEESALAEEESNRLSSSSTRRSGGGVSASASGVDNNNNYDNEAAWVAMITNAGFDMDDGSFLLLEQSSSPF